MDGVTTSAQHCCCDQGCGTIPLALSGQPCGAAISTPSSSWSTGHLSAAPAAAPQTPSFPSAWDPSVPSLSSGIWKIYLQIVLPLSCSCVPFGPFLLLKMCAWMLTLFLSPCLDCFLHQANFTTSHSAFKSFL